MQHFSPSQARPYHESISLESAAITIAADPLRFPCYAKLLEDFAEALMTNHKEQGDNFIQSVAAVVQDCARVLDRQLIRCMDDDLFNYRREQGIDAKSLNIREARTEYERYIKLRGEKMSYADYVHKTYPHLQPLLRTITRNYFNSIETMLQRLALDKTILCDSLLSTLGSGVFLKKITPTGSDYHLQGNQVFILEFANESNHRVKIVYKPTSMIADAMIVGDVVQLGKLDPQYAKQQSLLEKFNEQLVVQRMRALPTYLIIPRKDESIAASNMKHYYGYSEYLSHKPFVDIDYDELLEERLKSIQPAARADFIDHDLAKLSIAKAKSDIQKAAEQEGCDYITDDEDVIKQYSFDCGVLVVLMLASGLVDSHYGNLIIHKLRPYLVDNESCLVEAQLDLNRLLCLDFLAGSMSKNSLCEAMHAGVCLFDITGKHETPAKHPDKNILFLKNEDRIFSCQPLERDFKRGYQAGLNIVREGKILSWFDQPALQNMPVRLIVYPTDHFVDELETLLASGFSEAAFAEIARGNYESHLAVFKESQNSVITEHPMGTIYAKETMLQEYMNLSIPFYYGFASDTKLYDFNGDPVVLPEAYYLSRKADDEHKDFFVLPPLVFMQNRIKYMMSSENESVLAALINSQARFFEYEKINYSGVASLPRNKLESPKPRCIVS